MRRGPPSGSIGQVRRDGAARPVTGDTLSEVPGVVDFVFLADPVVDQEAWDKTMATPGATEVLARDDGCLRRLSHWDGRVTEGGARGGSESGTV